VLLEGTDSVEHASELPPTTVAWALEADVLREVLLTAADSADPRGLTLEGVWVKGRLDLQHAALRRPLAFVACYFDEAPNLRQASVPNLEFECCRLPGLMAEFLEVGGRLQAEDSLCEGMLMVAGASVGAQVSFRRTLIRPEAGPALHAEGLSAAALWLDDGFATTGSVRLTDCRIAGNVTMSGALIEAGDEPSGLHAERSRVGGTMFIDEGARITSTVRLSSSELGGLELSGARLQGEGTALLAERTVIHGNLLFDEKVSSRGAVSLRASRIAGQLRIADCAVDSEPLSIAAEDVVVDGITRLGPSIRCPGEIRLTRARLRQLAVPAAEADLPEGLDLTGCEVGDLTGALRDSGRAVARWLNRQPYSPDVWEQFAACFDRNGRPVTGRYLRWQAARRETRESSLLQRPLRWVYGALTGYGHYPLLAAVAVVIAAAAVGATVASNRATVVAVKAPAATSAAGAPWLGDHPCTDDYPCLRPALYAIDVVVPVIDIGQEASWQPLAGAPPGAARAGRHDATAIVVLFGKIVGWLAATLFLGGVTGLLRRS
jgi:hypothetical protein